MGNASKHVAPAASEDGNKAMPPRGQGTAYFLKQQPARNERDREDEAQRKHPAENVNFCIVRQTAGRIPAIQQLHARRRHGEQYQKGGKASKSALKSHSRQS